MCVRNGEQKGRVLKTCYSVRNDAAHGLCSRMPSVAWCLRFGRVGKSRALRRSPCAYQIVDQSITVIQDDSLNKKCQWCYKTAMSNMVPPFSHMLYLLSMSRLASHSLTEAFSEGLHFVILAMVLKQGWFISPVLATCNPAVTFSQMVTL